MDVDLQVLLAQVAIVLQIVFTSQFRPTSTRNKRAILLINGLCNGSLGHGDGCPRAHIKITAGARRRLNRFGKVPHLGRSPPFSAGARCLMEIRSIVQPNLSCLAKPTNFAYSCTLSSRRRGYKRKAYVSNRTTLWDRSPYGHIPFRG